MTSTSQNGFQIGALLAIAAHAIQDRVFAAYMRAGFNELRPAHTPVFQLLSADGDRVTDLALRANTTKQAMGYLVAYLEAHGYVERVPDPNDGRAQIVRRTAKGWEVNRLARRVVEDIQQEWTKQLGQERMEELLRALHALAQLIGVEYQGSATQVSAVAETSMQSK